MRILVVEDDRRIAASIRKGLTSRDFEVDVADNGEEGFYLLTVEPFDLLILDIMLPSRDGLEILGALRRLGNKIPVLLLTARDAVEDIVRGLDAGADAYMVKPFALPELLARIRALEKRGITETGTILTVGDLRIDVSDRSVSRAGVPLALSSQEFTLLEYFLRNKGNVVSREMLARDVWNVDRQVPLQNIIDVTISRLRRKIDEPFDGCLLQTIRGVGYKICA